MKHKIVTTKLGYAKRNRGSGIVDWAHVAKRFPEHREHIMRIRNNHKKLVALRDRLVKQ